MNLRRLSPAALPLVALCLACLCLGAPAPRTIRANGSIKAVNSVSVQVPRIEGLGYRLTLASVVENGAVVEAGQPVATFDPTNELKLLREAQTKLDDLEHQIEEKKADNNVAAERRNSDLGQAQADLRKAEIEIRKGPVLSAIDQEKNQIKLADAREHVASLQRSGQSHDKAERADLRILELQRDRQVVAVQRTTRNVARLKVVASIGGMVALENIWRNNSMGHAQEGDQLYAGNPLLRLFDPKQMDIEVAVGEPDGAVLRPGAKGTVHLDAFPDMALTAHFLSANPVATSLLYTSVRTFSARFRIDQIDPRLLPDLSAAIDIEAPK